MQPTCFRTWQRTCTPLLALALAVLPWATSPALADDDVARVTAESSVLVFEPSMSYDSVVLSVSGPKLTRTETMVAGGKGFIWDVFDTQGQPRPDGIYTYELRVNPVIDAEARNMLADARVKGNEEEVFLALCAEGRVPDGAISQSGYFLVSKSAIVLDAESEEKSADADSNDERIARGDAGFETSPANPDKQLITGDLTVRHSLCVGTDCLHPEAFGFDTVRLKENNLRIHFDDTSANNFPSNDWRVQINDSANGGGSYYSVVDATAGRRNFTIEAGAPSHALYVDSSGDAGFGTSTPVVDLHVVDGDSPTLRLEQNASSGFQPQTWDLAGNETSFFIRDATNGSTLPFRIRPGAASQALVIDTDSDIGLGTLSPSEDLHIVRSAVPIGVKLENSADGRDWSFKLSGSGFAINEEAEASTLLLRDSGEMRVGNNGAEEFVVRANGDTEIDGDLDVDGNISATGMISDRHRKAEFAEVDGSEVLEQVLALPVTTWIYKDREGVRHIGPMAQDLHATFGLGTEESIGLGDLGGLSLAAIQQLHRDFERQLENKDQELQQLRAESDQLRAESTAMQTRLAALEAALLSLQQN